MKILIMVLSLFVLGTMNLYSITELTTEYDYTVRGFIVADTGVKVRIKLEDQKEFVFSKAEILYLKELRSKIQMVDGQKYKAFIIDMTDEKVSIKDENGEKTLLKKDIVSIKHITEKNDVYNYFFAGMTFFSPNDINLTGGFQTKYIGIRAALGKSLQLNNIFFQGNLLFNLYKDKSMEHNLSIGIGLHEKYYVGLFYDINIAGFFAEAGYTSDTSTGGSFRMQIGYVYRFTR